MYSHGCLEGGVHGDAADFTYVRHGEDVSEGVRIEPYVPKILDCAYFCGCLGTTVGMDA
jgi:hypothetical protein